MLTIGDFSKLGHVSVRTLRYYDDMRLLIPAHVDPFTGYRYYSAGQLPRLNRILAFKDLGFSLEQIAQLLDEALPSAQIRGMLRLKEAEVRQQVQEEQERLARIEARLRRIEQEDTMSEYEIVLKSVPAQRVASIREVLPTFSAIGRLFDELRAYEKKHGIAVTAGTAIWHDTEFRERDVDGEAAFTTADPLPPDERITERTLPAIETAACVVHHGPFDSISQAYSAVHSWIEHNGYRIAGPGREVYHHAGNDQHDASYVTEVQFPIAKA